jgi:hypothetical protein
MRDNIKVLPNRRDDKQVDRLMKFIGKKASGGKANIPYFIWKWLFFISFGINSYLLYKTGLVKWPL